MTSRLVPFIDGPLRGQTARMAARGVGYVKRLGDDWRDDPVTTLAVYELDQDADGETVYRFSHEEDLFPPLEESDYE